MRTQVQNGACNILISTIILPYSKSCSSLWSRITENILLLSPINQMRVRDRPSGVAISKGPLLKERKKCFQSPGKVWHFCRPRTSTVAQMQAQSPHCRKPRAGSESSCRAGSPRVRRYSCEATMEALDGNLYEMRKDKVPRCQENHL